MSQNKNVFWQMKRMLIIIKPDYMQKGQMGKPFNGRAEGIHLWRAIQVRNYYTHSTLSQDICK